MVTGRKISRRALLRRVPAVLMLGGALQVSAACSPISFGPSTPEPVETPGAIPEQPSTPIPVVTPSPAMTPTPTPEPTPTPGPAEQIVRIAGTFLDPAHESIAMLPDCLQMAKTTAGLVRLNGEFELEPDWAESWEPLPDRDGWRFHVRENDDGWGDGLPVTAQDFAEHWFALLDPETSSRRASLLFDVENAQAHHLGEADQSQIGITAVDAWTLDVTLERQRATFPLVAASLALRPTGPAGLGDVVGCTTNGQFRESERGEESLTLTPSESFWENQQFGLERIEFTTLSPGMALTEFGQESLDLMRLTGMDTIRVRSDATVSDSIVPAQPQRIILLIPNVQVPPFDSVEVRRALGYLIDRRRLEQIVEGRVIPASRLLPTGMFPEFDDAATGITAGFDVDAAFAELEGSPYADMDTWPGFALDIPSLEGYLDRVARDVATQIRENLGIQVPIRVHDADEYAAGVRERQFPFYWLEWTYPYADPAATYAELFASWREPVRPLTWFDLEFDELVQSAESIPTSQERAQAWADCEALILEQGVCIPLVFPAESFLVQPWLDGLPEDGRGRIIVGETFGIDLFRNVSVSERPDD